MSTENPGARKAPRKRQIQPLSAASDPDALLTIATVAALMGYAPSTIRRMVRNKEFPGPTRRGTHYSRWRAGDVRAVLRGEWIYEAISA